MNTPKSYRITLTLICLTLVLALTISSVQASGVQQAEKDFATIDAYVTEQMNNLGIPGLALGIVKDDQIAHLQGFGVADSSGRKVTPQTPFYLGSLTKSFTALAVMQLVEAGKVDLDAPVQTYLPWFELADKEASAKITVHNLLNQTSGCSTKDGNQFWPSQLGLEETVRALNTLELTQPVGTTFQYCNLNYMIAGLIAEQVSGQSYDDYVNGHIFESLNMRHSFASRAPALADGLSEGHHYMFGQIFQDEGPRPPSMLPTGFLSASAEDMTHYMIAQLNDGRYVETSVLSPQGVTELHMPAIPAGEGYYAMGWFAGTAEGIGFLNHGGDTGRFNTYLLLVPDQDTGIVLLTNASGFEQLLSGTVDKIALGVFHLLNGEAADPVSIPFLAQFLYWGILIIPLLQILGILFVWRKRQGMKVWAVLLTVTLNLALVFFMLNFAQIEMPLPSLVLYYPELGYAAIAVASIGIGWSVIYSATFLIARSAKYGSLKV